MADLSTNARNHLGDEQFAYIDSTGERHLPIEDETHVRNAVSRFSQTQFESPQAKKKAAQAILKAAKKHQIPVDEHDAVQQAAR